MPKIWVIGGTSGIGRAVVERCAVMGDDVKATSENQVDVRQYLEISGYFHLESWFDGVVYSAGVNGLSWIKDLDPFSAENMLNVNVLGFMRLLQVVAEYNAAGGHQCRSVVAISSDAATRPMRTSMAYCASKAALEMAVRCAARELAPDTRVNAVSPGMIEGTEMTKYIDAAVPEIRGWTPDEAARYEASQVPVGRRGLTDEVAEVVFDVLHGPDFMTGSIVTVNGGR
jgi:NAD(P)-dependent dehydrogenase (short-subunit alcohol dehydrogenase family)